MFYGIFFPAMFGGKTMPKGTTHKTIRLLVVVVEVFCLCDRCPSLTLGTGDDFGFDSSFILFLLLVLLRIVLRGIIFEPLLLLLVFLIHFGCRLGLLGDGLDRFSVSLALFGRGSWVMRLLASKHDG